MPKKSTYYKKIANKNINYKKPKKNKGKNKFIFIIFALIVVVYFFAKNDFEYYKIFFNKAQEALNIDFNLKNKTTIDAQQLDLMQEDAKTPKKN